MKPPPEENEFNSPPEMLARAVFLVCIAAFTVGVIVTVAGLFAGDLRLLAWGAASLSISGLTRGWLAQQGHFERADAALEPSDRADSGLDPVHVAELVRLLREWEALERQRGSARFDPWALQAVRHDIREMVEKDPALVGLFAPIQTAS